MWKFGEFFIVITIDREVVRGVGNDQAWHLLAASTTSLFARSLLK